MPALPQAVLFDLDDTLISEGLRIEILLRIAIGFSEMLAPLKPKEVAERIDAALEAFWFSSPARKIARLQPTDSGIRLARERVILETFSRLGLEKPQKLAMAFATSFTKMRAESLQMHFGTMGTILGMRRAGIRLGIITNGSADAQRAKINRFGLAKVFDHIQIEGEHGFGKPDEQAYENALRALDVASHETWMVGDHLEEDVLTPQHLGIYGIWYDPRGIGLPAISSGTPDRIIQRISELRIPV